MNGLNRIFIPLPLYSILPITFSIITFIIGLLYIYLYYKKTSSLLIFLGFWVVCLSLFIFFVGFSHQMPDYTAGVWLARIYYIPLTLSLLFYFLLIYNLLRMKQGFIYYAVLGVCIAYLVIIFTKHFIPLTPCRRDFTGRFIFNKGFLYYIYTGFLYFTYFFTTLLLYSHPVPEEQRPFFNPRLYLISLSFLLVLGFNDFAGILSWYKTIPTLSYGFIVFILIGIVPYFKNYISYFTSLNTSYYKTIDIFAKVLENYDRENYRYYRQTGEYARLIGELMDFSHLRRENLRLAPILHNIGKIGLPQKYLTARTLPAGFKKKIKEGQAIISGMRIFSNMRALISFPSFTKIRKGHVYPLDVQILSLADWINEESTKQYRRNALQLDRLIRDILETPKLDRTLKEILSAQMLKLKNAVLENLLGTKDHV